MLLRKVPNIQLKQKLTGTFYSDVPSTKLVAIIKSVILNIWVFAWDASRNCIFLLLTFRSLIDYEKNSYELCLLKSQEFINLLFLSTISDGRFPDL